MKNQLLTFPQWERFLGGLCASGWGNVKNFFEKVLLGGKMLKSENRLLTFPQWERFFGCFAITLTTGVILKEENRPSLVGERQFERHFRRHFGRG